MAPMPLEKNEEAGWPLPGPPTGLAITPCRASGFVKYIMLTMLGVLSESRNGKEITKASYS